MNIEIANRLVNLRKEKNLSQEALAEQLGISRQAVSKWERAEASPDTDNLILLAIDLHFLVSAFLHIVFYHLKATLCILYSACTILSPKVALSCLWWMAEKEHGTMPCSPVRFLLHLMPLQR